MNCTPCLIRILMKTLLSIFFKIIIRPDTLIELIPIHGRFCISCFDSLHRLRNLVPIFNSFLFPKRYVLSTNSDIVFTFVDWILHILASEYLRIPLWRHMVGRFRIWSKLIYLNWLLRITRRFSCSLRTWFLLLTSFCVSGDAWQLCSVFLLIEGVALYSVILLGSPVSQSLAVEFVRDQIIWRSCHQILIIHRNNLLAHFWLETLISCCILKGRT